MRRSLHLFGGSLLAVLTFSNSALSEPALTEGFWPGQNHSVASLPDLGSIADLPKAAKKGLQLRAVASEGIENELRAADGSSNSVPSSLQGIWWLDGNPQAGSNLLTFAGVNYDEAKSEWSWKFSDPGHYAYTGNKSGLQDFSVGLDAGTAYRLSFSADGQEIRIKAIVSVFGQSIELPKDISDFTATLAADGHWVRHSKVFGISVADYDMRQIVDAQGRRIEPAYSRYLAKVGPISYISEKVPTVPEPVPELGSIPNLPRAKARGLQLKAVDNVGIEEILKPADGSNFLPESLQGIWWLDGNPAPGSNLISLAKAQYDEVKEEWFFRFSDPGIYAFTTDKAGISAYTAGVNAGIGYRLSFSNDDREFRILAVVYGYDWRITLPTVISDFTGTLVEEGRWLRRSRYLGGQEAPDYNMRQVVDANGQRVEPAYSQFIAKAGLRSYISEKISKTPRP